MIYIKTTIENTSKTEITLPPEFSNITIDPNGSTDFFIPPILKNADRFKKLDEFDQRDDLLVDLNIQFDDLPENLRDKFTSLIYSSDALSFDNDRTSISSENVQEALEEAINKADASDVEASNAKALQCSEAHKYIAEKSGEVNSFSAQFQSYEKPRHCRYYDGHVYVPLHRNPGGLAVYNVEPKGCIERVGFIELYNGPNKVDVRAYDDTAFVGANTGDIFAIDISDPTDPDLLDKLDVGSQLFDIDVNGDIVAVAETGSDGLIIADVSDLSDITSIFTASFSAGGVKIVEDYIYISDFGNDQLRIYDISDLNNVNQVGSISISGFPVPVQQSGDYVYVQEYQGSTFYVIDVTDRTSPTQVGTYTPNSNLNFPNNGGIEIRENGDLLYVFAGQDNPAELHVYDSSDPTSLSKNFAVNIGTPEQNINIFHPDVEGEYVYVPDHNNHQIHVWKNPVFWNNEAFVQDLQVLNNLDANEIEYTPANSGDWDGDPDDVYEALDRIAAEVANLKSGPIS